MENVQDLHSCKRRNKEYGEGKHIRKATEEKKITQRDHDRQTFKVLGKKGRQAAKDTGKVN